MNAHFYKPLPDRIEHSGKRYKLRLTAANVLRYIELCDEPQGLTNGEVTEIGFGWLVRGGSRLPLQEKAELLSRIFSVYINPPCRRLKDKEQQPVVSFIHDSGYIAAAFMQAYGIDLWECAEKMHWSKFITLFEGLPDGCTLKEIMHIRAQPLPVPDRHNLGEIQRLTELKALYALPVKAADEAEAADGWSRLFDILEGQVISDG